VSAVADPSAAAALAARSHALRANLRWTVAGNVAYAACQWGMLVLLARLGTPDLVGDFAFALALAAPIVLFAMLNLRAAQATDRRREFAFGDYVRLRIACLAAAALVLAAIVVCGRFDRTTAWTVALVGIAKAFDAMSDVVYGLLQQRESMRRIAVSRVLQGTLQLAGVAAALVATGSVVAAAGAMAAMSAAVTLGYDVASVRLQREGGAPLGAAARSALASGSWDFPKLARLAALALPLGLAAVLDAVNASVPRWALDAYSGRAALGIYAAVAYFLVGQGTVLTAVADVVRPRLARDFAESPEDFWRLVARLAAVAAACGVAGVAVAAAFGGELLRLLYGSAYAGQGTLLAWMMAIAIPWNLSGIATTAIGAARRFRSVSACFAVMTAVTAAASLLLVPSHGALGAAWALGAGMAARLAVACRLLARLRAPVAVRSALVAAGAR